LGKKKLQREVKENDRKPRRNRIAARREAAEVGEDGFGVEKSRAVIENIESSFRAPELGGTCGEGKNEGKGKEEANSLKKKEKLPSLWL